MHALCAPFNALLTKDTKWNWNKKCQVSYGNMKPISASHLLLTYHDSNLHLILAVDASDYGIEVMIPHKFHNGSQKAIFHASHKLNAGETNYIQI